MADKETENSEEALIDTVRLRSALLLACIELADGDLMEAWDLAEQYYDLAPNLTKMLEENGLTNLPGGPAQILPFEKKKS